MARTETTRRILLLIAGLSGAIGVALSAMASHMDDARLLGTAATMLLFHAPALLALGLWLDRLRLSAIAGLALVAGLVLFSGDLVFRHFYGHAIVPMAAPSGGILMIAGWLVIAAGALLPPAGGRH